MNMHIKTSEIPHPIGFDSSSYGLKRSILLSETNLPKLFESIKRFLHIINMYNLLGRRHST